jgi:ubiquinone/menaquinone biosynthesis C-methylase UbiE
MDDTDYALGRNEDEYDRLVEQAVLLRPLTERMLAAAGLSSGMRVLDVGCGVGDVSFLVSEVVGPVGSVVGVDLDAEAVSLAERRRASLRVSNVAFYQADVRAVEVNRLFDAAVGRFVLMYMRDPTSVLRLIAERVRPGGVVAFCEWCARPTTTASSSDQPALAWLQQALAETFRRSGANLEIGAELFGRMRDAGLEPDPHPLAEIAVRMDDPDTAYRRWRSFARSMLPKMIEYGVTTDQHARNLIEVQLRDELTRPAAFVPLSWLTIGQTARKPRHDNGDAESRVSYG